MSSAGKAGHRLSLHAVVLAAGGSVRFGSPKPLIRIAGQSLLIEIIARAAQITGPRVCVVLGASAEAIAPIVVESGASAIVNPDWREGMSSSIRAGISQLPGDADAVLLLLVDQPLIVAADLLRLETAWRHKPERPAAAEFSGIRGAPAIFPRALFPELLALRGDRGAQQILERHCDGLTAVPMENAALDVDTPEDLERLGTLPTRHKR